MELKMRFPIKNSNSRYVKTITNYEKSTWYMKRRANNNKRVAKMVVQKSGARKGSYIFNAFSGNGKRMTVDYDSRKKTRTVYVQNGKHGNEVLQSILHMKPTPDREWFKEIFNALGERISQIVKFKNADKPQRLG